MFSPARHSSLRLDATPSLIFSNLSSNKDCISFAHASSVHVLPCAAFQDVGNRQTSFRLQLGGSAPSPPGSGDGTSPASADSITQVGIVSINLGSFLVATTPSAFYVYPCADFTSSQQYTPRPVFSRTLADLGAHVLGDNKPEDHSFRGIAACFEQNALLVGTSWGAILVWRVDSSVLTLAQVLTGGHKGSITSIATERKLVFFLRSVCNPLATRGKPLSPQLSRPTPLPRAQLHFQWG
jgi:hypothetical protein